MKVWAFRSGLVVDGTAFQERSGRRAKVLLECDRRSTKIEIGNAEKEGGSTLRLVFFRPLSSPPMAVVELLQRQTVVWRLMC